MKMKQQPPPPTAAKAAQQTEAQIEQTRRLGKLQADTSRANERQPQHIDSHERLMDNSAWSEETQRGFADGLAVNEIGDLVRQLRLSRDLDQRQLAQLVRTSQSAISNIERGVGNQGPTFAMLKRIAEACGMEMTLTLSPKELPDGQPAQLKFDIIDR